MKGLRVAAVAGGSLAEEAGIEPGDLLVAVDGQPVHDLIDYRFHTGVDELVLELLKPSGEVWEIEIQRDEGESLGLVFDPPKPRRCGNRCIFCFVDQLPRGLRAPLYVKDEDYRLSFLYGNYVTLANVAKRDLKRIVAQRLSPLYVSVHATDPAVREILLGKQGGAPILPLLQQLIEAGIRFHTQVVLIPGVNDGEILRRTVADLAQLSPGVESLAVVPVGVTRYREGLTELRPVTPEYARSFVRDWLPVAERLHRETGQPFLQLADEWFLGAEEPFPPLEAYGDFPQIENGVGMVPLFRHEAAAVLRDAERLPSLAALIVTGESAYPSVSAFVGELSRKTGAELETVAIPNRLFGETVTVAGLVAGSDVVAALHGQGAGRLLVIPDVMLKEGEGVFLDDLTSEEVGKRLGMPVLVVEATPEGLYTGLRRAVGG